MSRDTKRHPREGVQKLFAVVLAVMIGGPSQAQLLNLPKDPGPRTSTGDVGQPFSTLTSSELSFFNDGKTRFQNTATVAKGLGPTFNATSCATCHSQPAVGGTSPATNPQIAQAPSSNTVPNFLQEDGPVLEARFPFYVNSDGTLSNVPDGSVHDLFTITGMTGAGSCSLSQPNFTQMQNLNNIIFRIPTPVFGMGLLEAISDETIINNMNANAATKASLGIIGVPNRSGNDGSITRFGWKAQNKSALIFAGEAYNAEMGITNEMFQNERGNSSLLNAANDPPTTCVLHGIPEDATNFTESGTAIPSDVVEFSHFMRFLAPPAQDINGIPGNPSAASIANGRTVFSTLGCDMCHTPSLTTTTNSSISSSAYDTGVNATTAFLSNQTVNLFSDLLLHHMGGLADGITQGLAAGDMFRTAPLWGAGQRLFFLHDGRAAFEGYDGLNEAIVDHDLPPPDGSGYPTSEAHAVISTYSAWHDGTAAQQQDIQDLLNFLRSL